MILCLTCLDAKAIEKQRPSDFFHISVAISGFNRDILCKKKSML